MLRTGRWIPRINVSLGIPKPDCDPAILAMNRTRVESFGQLETRFQCTPRRVR